MPATPPKDLAETSTHLVCMICGASSQETTRRPKCASWCPGKDLKHPTYRHVTR